MKRGKEYSVNLSKDYSVKFGTVDNKEPKTVYIQISSWGQPTEDKDGDYDRILKNKSKKIKQKIYDVLDSEQFHKNKTIVDFNMASSGIGYNKRSFMCVEATLFQKNMYPINSEKLKPKLESISETLINDVFNLDEHFRFHKRKK